MPRRFERKVANYHPVDLPQKELYKNMPFYNYKMSKKDLYGFIKEYYQGVRKILIYEKLPYKMSRMGRFYIRKMKSAYNRNPLNPDGTLNNKRPIDWAATQRLLDKKPELKQRGNYFIYFNTDYIYDIKWRKMKNAPLEERLTAFAPCRTFKNILSTELKNKNVDYYLE